ncbi:MAG: hypothetical protein MZU97_03300 [Bacillus subtilis]|nr:hypothetical protein [Bacillus subtilis]
MHSGYPEQAKNFPVFPGLQDHPGFPHSGHVLFSFSPASEAISLVFLQSG